MSPAGGSLFLLGLACGFACLPLTAYARTSPLWVRWLLISSGAFTALRYAALARAVLGGPVPQLDLGRLWVGSMIGLNLPSVFAVDALIRHPAMTPKKLLLRFSPFLAADAVLLAVGHDGNLWRMLAITVQAVFAAGFAGLCLLLIQQIPVPAIRIALWILAASHVSLGVVGVLPVVQRWSVEEPFLVPEMLTLLAIWFTFQTAERLQASS